MWRACVLRVRSLREAGLAERISHRIGHQQIHLSSSSTLKQAVCSSRSVEVQGDRSRWVAHETKSNRGYSTDTGCSRANDSSRTAVSGSVAESPPTTVPQAAADAIAAGPSGPLPDLTTCVQQGNCRLIEHAGLVTATPPAPSPDQAGSAGSATVAAPNDSVGRLIIGIDEAGRGAAIGPLVLAAVALSRETEQLLYEAGVRDSKFLTPKKRTQLAALIKQHAEEWRTVSISSKTIDEWRLAGGNLNALEAQVSTSLVRSLQCYSLKTSTPSAEATLAARLSDSSVPVALSVTQAVDLPLVKAVVVDAVDSSAERYRLRMQFDLGDMLVRAEHGADSKYVVVAAASILAKTARDAAVADLARQWDMELGSGYPSDVKTRAAISRIASGVTPSQSQLFQRAVLQTVSQASVEIDSFTQQGTPFQHSGRDTAPVSSTVSSVSQSHNLPASVMSEVAAAFPLADRANSSSVGATTSSSDHSPNLSSTSSTGLTAGALFGVSHSKSVQSTRSVPSGSAAATAASPSPPLREPGEPHDHSASSASAVAPSQSTPRRTKASRSVSQDQQDSNAVRVQPVLLLRRGIGPMDFVRQTWNLKPFVPGSEHHASDDRPFDELTSQAAQSAPLSRAVPSTRVARVVKSSSSTSAGQRSQPHMNGSTTSSTSLHAADASAASEPSASAHAQDHGSSDIVADERGEAFSAAAPSDPAAAAMPSSPKRKPRTPPKLAWNDNEFILG